MDNKQMDRRQEIVYRFLKARSYVDRNAGAMAEMIRNGSAVDAAIIPMEHLKQIEHLSGETNLMHYTFFIQEKGKGGNVFLCYPQSERQKFMDIQAEVFGGKVAVYKGFSYSEAKYVTDLLKAVNVDYRVELEEKMITIRAYEKNAEELKFAVNKLQEMIDKTEYGQENLIYQNSTHMNAIHQASTAINMNDDSIIGSESGSAFIYMSSKEKSAYVFPVNGDPYIIPYSEKEFEKKLINAVLKDLSGDFSPVKAFHGKIAEKLGENILMSDIKKALKVMGMEKVPKPEEIDEIRDVGAVQHPEAFACLERASCFRFQRVEVVEDKKPPKQSREAFRSRKKDDIKDMVLFAREKTRRMEEEQDITLSEAKEISDMQSGPYRADEQERGGVGR